MRLTDNQHNDFRYESITCVLCGETHQRIDFKGNPHAVTHRAKGLPQPEYADAERGEND